MVKITIFQNQAQQMIGFDSLGHADYADGDDIVCAAVSALVINCINSVETFCTTTFRCEADQGSGMIQFRVDDPADQDAQLLLNSLALGLGEIESNYEENIDILFEEV